MLQRFMHAGDFGDSGRLSKEEQQAMRRYLPKIELSADPAAVASILNQLRPLLSRPCTPACHHDDVP